MGTELIHYNYTFQFEDGSSRQYNIAIDSDTCKLVNAIPKNLPGWTHLLHHQCPHCPLQCGTNNFCPAAANIASVVDNCDEIISHKSVTYQVESTLRCISGSTTAQRALSSLLGLLIATSDCPHTQFFRPMAYFHLPMASQEETIFRALSTYFLAKYFKRDKTEVFSFDTLCDVYANMQIVNEHLVKRLQSCTSGDATKNAVVLLHLLSCVLPMSLEDSLGKLRLLFKGLLAEE